MVELLCLFDSAELSLPLIFADDHRHRVRSCRAAARDSVNTWSRFRRRRGSPTVWRSTKPLGHGPRGEDPFQLLLWRRERPVCRRRPDDDAWWNYASLLRYAHKDRSSSSKIAFVRRSFVLPRRTVWGTAKRDSFRAGLPNANSEQSAKSTVNLGALRCV